MSGIFGPQETEWVEHNGDITAVTTLLVVQAEVPHPAPTAGCGTIEQLINSSIRVSIPYSTAKVPTMYSSRLLKCDFMLVYLLTFYDGKLNIFGFWTAGWTKETIWGCQFRLWKIATVLFFTTLWHFNRLIEKITGRLVDNENNPCTISILAAVVTVENINVLLHFNLSVTTSLWLRIMNKEYLNSMVKWTQDQLSASSTR